MKNVKNKLKERGASEDEIKEFEKGAQAYAKKLVGDKEFDKKYEFLIGEKMDPDGMYVEFDYREETFTDTRHQGRPPQLPRRRCHTLRNRLEARFD